MVNLSVEPMPSGFGAMVLVSAHQLLESGVPEQCLELLNHYGVLVFPQIDLSDEQQVAFSNRLGVMEASRLQSNADTPADGMGIYPVTLDPGRAKSIDYILSNEHWHMDGTTYRIPPKATCLRCLQPASSGGDTEFANLYMAYEQLPEDKKAELSSLKVIHSAANANFRTFPKPSILDIQRWLKDGPPTEQPLVWQQSDGRCSLVIGSTADHIVGMDLEAGRALLRELLTWCTELQFCYRHQWQQGDLVIWNNPGLLHRAHHYTPQSGRLMHRTTIKGSEALA